YADKLKDIMASLASGGELPNHPLLQRRPVERALYIVLTSDRGLAGAFNTSLLRLASDTMKGASHDQVLVTYGKKASQFFSRRGFEIIDSISAPSAGARLEDAVQVTRGARQMFENGEVDAVYVVYAKFMSAIRQVPRVVQLLPIEAPEGTPTGTGSELTFEPSPEAVLDVLLPRYFQTLVWQAMLESTASEFGARMTAMTGATDNAGKMITELTLTANRERQAAITKEILEVVGGAEALNN
ncbi:ATP synthase F1 subunit gamma, partial [bacterium]